jgi:hypothetical protein
MGENHRINVPIFSVRMGLVVFLLWVILDASMLWAVVFSVEISFLKSTADLLRYYC